MYTYLVHLKKKKWKYFIYRDNSFEYKPIWKTPLAKRVHHIRKPASFAFHIVTVNARTLNGTAELIPLYLVYRLIWWIEKYRNVDKTQKPCSSWTRSKYFYHFLRTYNVRENFNRYRLKVTLGNISLHRIKFTLPPKLTIQQKARIPHRKKFPRGKKLYNFCLLRSRQPNTNPGVVLSLNLFFFL